MLAELKRVLRILLYGWIVAFRDLIQLLIVICRRRKQLERLSDRERKKARAPCVPIDRPEFKHPDPLIYDQYYLLGLGLAVTWDNPDIELRKGGVPVSSSRIDPDTTYEIVARI